MVKEKEKCRLKTAQERKKKVDEALSDHIDDIYVVRPYLLYIEVKEKWLKLKIIILDSWRGFHTQELAARGSLWGGHKGMKPETNTLKEQHTPLNRRFKLCGGVC
jgi:hypothetical protein